MIEKNKIYNMDCIEGMKQMEDQSVNLIIIDPPYEVDYMGKQEMMRNFDHGTKKHSIQSVDSAEVNINWKQLCWQLRRVLKVDSHCYIWVSEALLFKLKPLMEDMGFKFVQFLIWTKGRVTLDGTFGHKYMYQHELIAFLG